MPSRAARICGKAMPGGYCRALVRDDAPCPVHGPKRAWQGAHAHKAHYKESTRLKPVVMQRDYGRACPRCGEACVTSDDHVDHYPVSLAEGGETTLDNLRRAHGACNVAAGSSLGRHRRKASA
jgi:5-methylcytosine-specific restriction endonuclease McrA